MGQLGMSGCTGENEAILLAAQPIYDGEDSLSAVELLYRNELRQTAMQVGEERATSEVLYNFCAGISRQAEHYSVPAYINVSAEFLKSQAFLPLDPDQVVVELVERIEPTTELIKAVELWHKRGFRFALDDFAFCDSWRPLLPFSHCIKVDVLGVEPEQVIAKKERLENLSCHWLAERIEDQETRDLYRQAGFDLFQGYFLAQPRVLYGRKMSPSALQFSRIMSALYADDMELSRIANLIALDPALSISLLKVANSPLNRTRRRFRALDEVVVHLGLERVRRWVMLIRALDLGCPEAARLVLTRALVCARLTENCADLPSGRAFLAGLLSGVDVLLGMDPAQLIATLDIDEEVRDAVLLDRGPLGAVLENARQLERSVALKTEVRHLNEGALCIYVSVAGEVQMLMSELG